MKKTIILILFSTLGWHSLACSKKHEAVQADKPVVVANVTTETVRNATTSDFYEAVGSVESKTATTLSSKTVGTITAFNVNEGDHVRVGQLLAEIENRDARAQVERAQAGLREAQTGTEEVEKNIRAAEAAKAAAEAQRQLAESTLKRYQALLDRKSVSPQEFDETSTRFKVASAEVERAERMLQAAQARRAMVQARIEQAKAEIASAQVMASYSRITAPINGVVTAKQAALGTLAAPGAPLLTLEDNASYRLVAAVEESQMRRIALGQTATVLIDALGDAEISAKVVEIVPAADPATRSYSVKLALPPQRFLRSGLYGKARFAAGERQALTVLQSAIVQNGQLSGVYVLDSNGIARLRLLTLGKRSGDRVEILSGLNDGERIVTTGTAIPREGVKVQ
jgi:multidrug efflux pump subunit AcrA (membrane-fusion protein)